MRTRLALVLALTFIFSLLPAVGAISNVDTSTQGVRVLRVPGAELGTAVAINDAGWVALNTAIWWGIGYPHDLWPGLTAMNPGAGFLAVVGMDTSGEVVGTYRNVSDRSFLWSNDSGMQDIGVRTATGIDGEIVGYLGSNSFIGRPGALATIAQTNFLAQGINSGLVVGNGGTWTAVGGYVALPENGVGYDANSPGTIVGHIAPGGGILKAAYWPSQSSEPVDIGTLPGDTMSQARAINDSGWIVGWSGTSASPSVARRAFVWRSAAEGMIDLGFYPGDSTADAFDINSAGVIVGKSGFGPVIWDINNVFDIDYPPEVEPFGPLTVNAGQFLDETIVISDLEGHPSTATWTGLPAGATWDGESQLTWQSSPTDEGSYPISLTVTQNSEPLNTITVETTIEVGPPPPALDPIGDQTATVGQDLAFAVTASPGTPGNSLSFSLSAPTATGAAIDPADGVFSWTPPMGQEGDHAVTIRVSETVCDLFTDPLCTTPTVTDEEAITITVAGPGVDQPPVLTAIVETIGEHETVSIPRSDFLSDPDTPIGDIVLTLEAGIDPVPLGALINGIFSWTPGELDGGSTYEFTMRAADTSSPPNEVTAPITITVLETNARPAIDPVLPQSIEVGQTLDVTVTATDTDIPADDLTFSVFDGPGSIHPVTGLYQFTPTSPGPVSAWVAVSDGHLDDLTEIVIDVTDSNQPPDAVQDSYRTNEDIDLIVDVPGVLLNDRDPEGHQMIAILVDLPQSGSVVLEETGAFRYTPKPDFNGTDVFTYYAYDGSPSATTDVRITVDSVNDDPTLEPIGNRTVFEGFNMLIDPVEDDVDDDLLTHEWLGDRPPNALINGIFDFSPDEVQGGDVYTIEYLVTDGQGGEARETFTITVIETNQPPSLAAISDQQVFTGDDVTFDADATDPDLPAQALAFSLEGAPSAATIDSATGEFSWSGATTGSYIFDVVVRDNWVGPSGPAAAEDRSQVTILVVDPLDLPNDVSVDLWVVNGDPGGDGVVDLGQPVTLRAAIAEANFGAGNVNVAVAFSGAATLVSSTGDVCESFTLNGDTVLSCQVGPVFGSENLDIIVILEDSQIYSISAEVTSSAVPETDVADNTDTVTLEARLRISVTELVGVSDVVDAVPPLDLARIIENIAVTDSRELVHDTDGSGIPDVTATAVDPITGQPLSEAIPGTKILVTGSGMLPNSPATVVLFSDPVHLADIVTDGDGSFAVVVTIPPDTAAGEHRIIVSGEWQHSGPIEVIFPISVLGICTITGTDGFDILVGTSGDDVICGFGGNDLIIGGRGDDVIFGGAGNDVIFGSRGDDDLFGEAGDDVVFGGRGNDHLSGGLGADLLIGGRGDDTILQ